MAAVLLLLVLLGGCAGTAPPPAEPRTPVAHRLGTAFVPQHPARVVALGPADVDAALALGVRPVGVGLPLSAELPPWQRRPGWHPTTLRPTSEGYSAEAIAALHPDLILAGSDYYIDREYPALSAIAPTTAFETAPDEEPWQATTRQVGAALGESARADELVSDVERRIRAASAAHPQLAGAEFAITLAHSPGGLGVIRTPRDVTARTLAEFGMRFASAAQHLPGKGFSAQLSAESLHRVDTDVLLTSYPDPALRPQLESSPVFRNLNVVRRGGYLPVLADSWLALREPGVLAIPHLIDNVVPDLSAAAQHR